MENDEGVLSKEQSEQVAKWLNEKWVIGKCPYCGNANWEIGDIIAHAPQFGTKPRTEIKTYPLVVVTCSNCANTVLINAMSIKILSLNKEGVSSDGK